MPDKNLLRAFVLIFAPYAALITAGFLVFSTFQYTYSVGLIRKNETVQLELVARSIVRDLEVIPSDLRVLVYDQSVQRFVNQPTGENLRWVEEELASFARSKPHYYQIRLLDTQGQERVRVVQDNDRIRVTPVSELQSKQDRYYFRPAISLGPDELYISPFDLNVEYGELVKPYQPTIRFAMPIYDKQQRVRALMIINYDGEYLLSHFDQLLSGSYGHIAFLNNQAYWIRSHHKEREWGFMLGHDKRFSQKHAEEWERIRRQDKGQIRTADGLFTFMSVYPLKLYSGYDDNSHENHDSHQHVDQDSYAWKLVSDVPSRVFDQVFMEHILGFFGLVWLALMLLGVVLSFYLGVSYLERSRLREQNELHAKIYDSSTEGIIITNHEQAIIDVNAAFLNISGYTRKELLGERPSKLSSGLHDANFYKNLRATLRDKGYWEGEISNRHKDGGIYTEWIRISAITNQYGDVVNYIAMVSDITQRKSTEEQLIQKAHHDPLTGAHNRLSFDERLEHDLLMAKRNQSHVALLYLDLDRFKPVNDEYGHRVGDVVLQTITRRIEKNIRETDMLARLGGDEFAIILSQVDSLEHVTELVETLSCIIHEPCCVEGLEISVGVSIGMAIYPEDADNPEQLLARADSAMYKIKEQHRSKF